jgi:hypothetical protein
MVPNAELQAGLRLVVTPHRQLDSGVPNPLPLQAPVMTTKAQHTTTGDIMSRRIISLTLSAALSGALAAGLLGAPAAQAAIYSHVKIDGHFAGSFTECGIPIDYTWEGTGVDTIRTIDGTDQAYLDANSMHTYETWTNPANGKWFSASSHVNFRETSGTHIDGDIWRFDHKTTIGNSTITSSDGTVLYRDSGLVRDYVIFDTLGDHQPGGVIVGDGFISSNGHFTSPEFCDLVASQLS